MISKYYIQFRISFMNYRIFSNIPVVRHHPASVKKRNTFLFSSELGYLYQPILYLFHISLITWEKPAARTKFNLL